MRIFEASIAYKIVRLGDEETLSSSTQAANYIKTAFEENPLQESLWVILLDQKKRAIGRAMMFLGTQSSVNVFPRDIFKLALLSSAASVIVAHNHPGGDPRPSNADIKITKHLFKASELMGIPLDDHLIIGDPAEDPEGKGYFSFKEAGVI